MEEERGKLCNLLRAMKLFAISPGDLELALYDPGTHFQDIGTPGQRIMQKSTIYAGRPEERCAAHWLVKLAKIVKADLRLRQIPQLRSQIFLRAHVAQNAVSDTFLGKRTYLLFYRL